MRGKIYLLLGMTADISQAHASTLGNINGFSGWAKFLTILAIPNLVIFLLALPFFVAFRMKGAAVSKIAMHVLFYETLAAGAGYLILYLVFSLN
jgi:hypothetical protein